MEVDIQKIVKVAVIGNVDSGKSTLTCILSSRPGMTDDGNGSMRKKVFNFAHEAESGRTTSIGHEIMGFTSEGVQVVPDVPHDSEASKNKNSWPKIVQNSKKIIQFLDLCGHEKYFKTTLFGLSGLYPHYTMVVVGANMGVPRVTREHIGVAIALKLPMMIIVTKIDLAPKEIFEKTMTTLTKIIRGSFCNMTPALMKSQEDITKFADVLPDRTVCPIFAVSNVTGAGIDLLKDFMFNLKSYDPIREDQITDKIFDEAVECDFPVDSQYTVKGFGKILGGTVTKGEVKVGQNMMLGPDKNGKFKPVTVKGIQVNRVFEEVAKVGTSCTLNIKSASKKDSVLQFRKGMHLISGQNSTAIKNLIGREIEAEIVVLHHATSLQVGYQAVLHCENVQQSVRVEEIISGLAEDQTVLRSGDKALVRLKFMYSPELVKVGAKLMFRDSGPKVLGYISSIRYGVGLTKE